MRPLDAIKSYTQDKIQHAKRDQFIKYTMSPTTFNY